jgi:hypothetical protein
MTVRGRMSMQERGGRLLDTAFRVLAGERWPLLRADGIDDATATEQCRESEGALARSARLAPSPLAGTARPAGKYKGHEMGPPPLGGTGGSSAPPGM